MISGPKEVIVKWKLLFRVAGDGGETKDGKYNPENAIQAFAIRQGTVGPSQTF
jgi:hypothetical protein